MGKTPKGGLLLHAYNHLGPRPGTLVGHAVVPHGHDHVKPTATLPLNFESAGAVPLMEGNNVRGEAMREAETWEDGLPQM
uniref:Uncharacterized protein n=1 Tax=Oryza rufipogon TaxID=4529 RepID=A0A0E0PQN4_ORYRU